MRAALIAVAFATAATATLAYTPDAHACAGCRNPNLPIGRSDAGPTAAGALNLSTALTGTYMDISHPAGCENVFSCDEFPVQPAHTHDLTMIPVELRAVLSYGITEVWSVDAHLPFRMVRAVADYHTPDGEPYTPIDEGVHHRTETLFGFSDAQVGARAAVKVGNWWLTPRLALTVPIGRTEVDPYEAGDNGVSHQHVQFGTGTVDPVLGFDATTGNARTQYALYGQMQASVYQNRHGFRGPMRGTVGASVGWKSPRRPVVLSLGLEGSFEGPERWGGRIYTEELQGRQEVLAVPRVSWTSGITTLSADLRVIVFRRLVEGAEETGELTSPAILTIAASWGLREGR